MKKHTVCDILVKQLAHNFRQLYPDLRIEGHPLKDEVYNPIIIITNKDRNFLLRFIFICQANSDIIIVQLHAQQNIRTIQPKRHTVELPNPNSIAELEQWMHQFIQLYVQK